MNESIAMLLPEERVEAVTPPATARSAPGEGGEVRYVADVDGKQRKVEIYFAGRLVRAIDDRFGEFEEELPPSMSSSGKIVLLHQVESGAVHSSTGDVQRHERYYCNFVDMRSGCILERRSANFCAGEWAGLDAWQTFDGRKIDLLARRVTAKQVAQSGRSADDPVRSDENLRHCDPPISGNHRSYTALFEKPATYHVSDAGDLVRSDGKGGAVVVPGVDDDATTYDVYVVENPSMGPVLVRERFGGDRQMLLVPINPELEVDWVLSLSIDTIGSLGRAAPAWHGVELELGKRISLTNGIWEICFEALQQVDGRGAGVFSPGAVEQAGEELSVPALVYAAGVLVGTTTYLAPNGIVDPRTIRRADLLPQQ